MGKRKPAPTLSALPRHYSSAALVFTIAVGAISALASSGYVAIRFRETLTQHSRDIANSLPVSSIASLSGSSADLNTTAYDSLKLSLKRLRFDNRNIQTAQLVNPQDDTIVILASSASTAPGTPLGQSNLSAASLRDTAFLGPHDTKAGNMISGQAPIIDTETGQQVATLILDVPTSLYYQYLLTALLAPLFLISIPLTALILDRRAQKQEREIMRLKTQFISVASHELRSPLSGMLWAVQSLLKPSVKNLTIEQQVILLDMYQSAEESLATINEILDMSAMERNDPTRLVKKEIDIRGIVQTSTKTLRLSATERGIKFVFVGNWDDTSALTIGDPSALKRMFMNLIANAIKYGKDNTDISIRLTSKSGTHIVAIEDHGIGIPQAEQERVLKGYYRAQNARETQRAGTGLGLLLAKLVAEQHDGKLWLNSKEGRGTTVYVSLPDAKAPQSTTPKN